MGGAGVVRLCIRELPVVASVRAIIGETAVDGEVVLHSVAAESRLYLVSFSLSRVRLISSYLLVTICQRSASEVFND